MADSGSFDPKGHCDSIRSDKGLSEGDSSTCWEEAYNDLPATYNFQYNSIIDAAACDCDGCTTSGMIITFFMMIFSMILLFVLF